jgi:hypothetical protein
VEDKLSDSLLRGEFKVFERVFELQTTIKIPEAMAGIVKALKEIPYILSTESSGDSLTVFSSKSLKFEAEKIIKDQIKEAIEDKPEGITKDKDILEPRVSESSYISYVVVDMRDGEIVTESRDNFVLPDLAAVGALLGDDKS